MKGRQIARLVALMQIARQPMRRRMPPLADLAREHGCCERTIRRDLEAIELHMPVPAWDSKPGPKSVERRVS